MAHLTAVVTVLAHDLAGGMTHAELNAQLPEGPLTLETFMPLGNRVTPHQIRQIQVGVGELRRAFSGHLLTHLILRRVSADTLARTDVASEEARTRLENGGILVSLPVNWNVAGEGMVGRPDARSIDEAFKHALAQAVTRIIRLAGVAEREDYENFDGKYKLLGERLQSQDALFNLNSDHTRHHDFPVLNWCETRGAPLLAAAYGMEENELEGALDAALRARIKQRRFDTVWREELSRIETLIAWHEAHVARKQGEASRRDTTRRLFKEHGLDWNTAPGAVAPPRMHTGVRRNIVAEKAMARLTSRAMVEAACLFDLEPAYSVFLTRLYLLPILASAGLAGRVGMRGQVAKITSPIAAGGLVALAENPPAGNDRVGAASVAGAEDEIGTLQTLVYAMLERSGLAVADLAGLGRSFLRTNQPVAIYPPARPRRFFFDD